MFIIHKAHSVFPSVDKLFTGKFTVLAIMFIDISIIIKWIIYTVERLSSSIGLCREGDKLFLQNFSQNFNDIVFHFEKNAY